jgi:hypothetical protein
VLSAWLILYLHFSFQIIKMMITVVVIYAICWLPLNIINFTGAIDNSIYNITGMNYIWMASHWLAMSNCMYNPFIYCWMNAKFRNGFLRVLNCFTCGFVNCQESMALQSLRRQDTMLTSMNGHSGSTRRFNSSKRSSSTSKRSYCEYTAMKRGVVVHPIAWQLWYGMSATFTSSMVFWRHSRSYINESSNRNKTEILLKVTVSSCDPTL